MHSIYYYIGEFLVSLTHLSVLRAATSKLIANDAMEFVPLYCQWIFGYGQSSYVSPVYFQEQNSRTNVKNHFSNSNPLFAGISVSGHPGIDDA